MTFRRYSTFGTFTLTLVLGSAAVSASCGPTETTCDDGIGCVGDAGSNSAGKGGSSGASSGASSGDAGKSGGGSPMTGGNGATAGDGGSGDAGGGVGGEAGGASQPCDGACTDPTPVCKGATDTCVECLAPADCTVGDEDLCDTTSNTCVECLNATTDCASATASRCEAGACSPCEDNNDCAHIAGKTVCDTTAGECVQCTGTDYTSCGMDAGTPLVCDSLARTCTTSKQASAGLCQPCVADAQCSAGKLCVMETFGAQDDEVGYFCFWKQGANGAPADCAATGRPYVDTLVNQTSIDGVSGDVCGLRLTTCVARNQFSSKDCSTNNAPDDSKCGFASGQDSKCAPFGATQFRCTVRCLSSDDCDEDVACDLGAAPRVCEL